MKTLKGYDERKAAGVCVYPGCEEKPLKNEDGTRRSYCPTHNELNKTRSIRAKLRAKTKFVLYLEPAQLEALRKLSAKTGAPVAELIRRAVALYLKP